jgi:hypothetical protein
MKLKKFLLIEGHYDYKQLKKNKIPLTPEERAEAMRRGAVWHPGNHEKPTCAIWKSKKADGTIVYGCNTHRAMQIKPTLKGAINAFKFIKTTA